MLTEYEARKLQEDIRNEFMRKELHGVSSMMLMSAAGLVIVLALGVIGSRADVQRDAAYGSRDVAEQHDRHAPAAQPSQPAERGRERLDPQHVTRVSRDHGSATRLGVDASHVGAVMTTRRESD